MVELVVGAQGGQSPGPDGVGEEDLRGGVYPALRVPELAPVGSDVEQEACPSTLQGDGFEEESYDDEVGEQSREPDYLARGVESLVDDEIDDQPGQYEGAQELPLDPSRVLDPLRYTQNSPTGEESHRGDGVTD